MRIMVIGLAATIAGCTAPPPSASDTALPELAGLVAGAPQRCVTFGQADGLHIAGPHTITLRSGGTIYVNSVPQCSELRSTDILVTEPFGTQYCRGDFVRTRDNVSFIQGPGCRLNDFVPYRKG
jgi:hypothetical protein